MSMEEKETYMGENKSILMYAQNFQNIAIKMSKADVSKYLTTDGILPAGTPVTKDGKVVDGTTITGDKAIGITYRNVNFKYSNGNESVPVTIFGFVKLSAMTALVTDSVKAALKMIQFL